jgi:ubiquinone/menaquinone biosynthesis C-methylase UbiE
MARMNGQAAATVVGLLAIGPKDRVLEIGFGSGVGVALAARKAAFVAGADPSRVMVAQAKSRNDSAIVAGRVDLRQAEAEALGFDGGAFDKVFSVNSMQLWADRQRGLREVRRVTKRGGRIALGFTPNSGQGKQGVVETLTAAGFSNVRLVDADGCFCALAENL